MSARSSPRLQHTPDPVITTSSGVGFKPARLAYPGASVTHSVAAYLIGSSIWVSQPTLKKRDEPAMLTVSQVTSHRWMVSGLFGSS